MQTCVDCFGVPVSLSDDTERHIAEQHPDADAFLHRLCEVLEDPSLVCFRERTQGYMYYRRGLTEGRYSHAYLVAVVRFDAAGQSGEVRTWYMTTVPANDRIIHVSPNLLRHS